MRALFILPFSAALLAGCLTTQENPNYEFSTAYQGEDAMPVQQASVAPAAVTAVTYETLPAAATVPAQSRPVVGTSAPATVLANSPTDTAPTDTAYGAREVSGTPGFMMMETARQAAAIEMTAEPFVETQPAMTSTSASAGTPVAYDFSRNFVRADTVISNQVPETVRVMQGAGHNYTVQQGDTVYSLSRKTCVGVNVIQSMNGLDANYAIQIGQSLTLPASVC